MKKITGTAEPKVVKFCTHVGYISSSNRMKGVVMATWLLYNFAVCCDAQKDAARRAGLSSTVELLVVKAKHSKIHVNC